MENNLSNIRKSNLPGGMALIEAQEFKRLLRAAGWNQKKLCEALGYSQGWLSRIIHGAREMNCKELIQISDLTGISPLRILGYTPREAPPADAGSDEQISKELAEILPEPLLEKLVKIVQDRKSLPSKK